MGVDNPAVLQQQFSRLAVLPMQLRSDAVIALRARSDQREQTIIISLFRNLNVRPGRFSAVRRRLVSKSVAENQLIKGLT